MYEKGGLWRVRFDIDGVERFQDALADNILQAISMSTSWIIKATGDNFSELNITKIELLRD